ncbi:DUF6894 family protein [Microvirga sesbaniae]|uniref:DUF6894 family protein n=1 Tax=Microvirga sesbaniae TaxID=681392 RepID=UPI0021C8E345|nr:hypothetical protein [Microvirga sp. HBU67692]
MKRFYFDLFDGRDVSRDEVGTTFDDHNQAQNAAAESLLELMKSRRTKGAAAELVFLVRDASDMAAFAVRLSLQVTSQGMLFGPASDPVPSLCP